MGDHEVGGELVWSGRLQDLADIRSGGPALKELPKDGEVRCVAAGVDLDAAVCEVSNRTRKSKLESRLSGPPAEANALDPSGENEAASLGRVRHGWQSQRVNRRQQDRINTEE